MTLSYILLQLVDATKGVVEVTTQAGKQVLEKSGQEGIITDVLMFTNGVTLLLLIGALFLMMKKDKEAVSSKNQVIEIKQSQIDRERELNERQQKRELEANENNERLRKEIQYLQDELRRKNK